MSLSIKHHKKIYQTAFLSVLFCLNFLIWLAIFNQTSSELLKVEFFDIGQGSAVFIEAPNRNQILIDGGPDDKILSKLGKIMPFYDQTIDLIILTHPDKDHLDGLIEVLKRYQVKQILETGVAHNSAAYQIWHDLIIQKEIPVTIAQTGQIIKIAPHLKMDIYYPFDNLKGQALSNANDVSIVGRLIYNQNSFLLTGDATKKVEERLVNNNFLLTSNILLVSHHGSKYSSSENFLKQVNPQIAVIQAGRANRYGHPHEEVLQRLKEVLILRTDINQDIHILSDGENINYY